MQVSIVDNATRDGAMDCAGAEHDHCSTVESVEWRRQIFDEARIKGSVELYPEAEHGFAFRSWRSASSKPHREFPSRALTASPFTKPE